MKTYPNVEFQVSFFEPEYVFFKRPLMAEFEKKWDIK